MLLSNTKVLGQMGLSERDRLNFWLLKAILTRVCVLKHHISPVGDKSKLPIKIIQQ
jgi:hypothetical protein